MVEIEKGNGDCGICYFILKEEENTVGRGERQKGEANWWCLEKQ